jgi:hypothetical protein
VSLFNDLFRKSNSPKNPGLERAMGEVAASDNPKTRETVYRSILSSTLIIQGRASGGTEIGKGKRVADSETQVAFHTIEHPPGNLVLPVFTSIEALSSWAGSEVPWIALPARALFQSIAPGNIVEVRVNPFRPGQTNRKPGGTITRNEFLALAQGLLPGPKISSNTVETRFAAGQKVLIGKPAKEPPPELLSRLAEHFQRLAELQGAYVFQMAIEIASNTVIGLHFAVKPEPHRMEQVMRGIGDVVRGQIPPEMSLDFMPLKDGSFWDDVRKSGKVLYQKPIK